MLDLNIFTKPLVTIWQFFMADEPQVLKSELRIPPGAGRGAPEGYSYTVQLAAGVTREVFMLHDIGAPVDYKFMFFVKPEAEGANFYATPRKDRFTDEVVTQAVKNAARIFDEGEAAKKNIEPPPAPEGAFLRVQQASRLTH